MGSNLATDKLNQVFIKWRRVERRANYPMRSEPSVGFLCWKKKLIYKKVLRIVVFRHTN